VLGDEGGRARAAVADLELVEIVLEDSELEETGTTTTGDGVEAARGATTLCSHGTEAAERGMGDGAEGVAAEAVDEGVMPAVTVTMT
jgi:hypothetical protein